MRIAKSVFAALALTLSLGLAAEARADAPRGDQPSAGQNAPRAHRPRPTFEQLDKNHDGRIVAGEVPERAWSKLSRADADHDGAVTKAELDAAVAARRAARADGGRRGPRSFEELDKNHDGKIVASEVPAQAWQRISRADANHDNAVTKAELDAARANHQGRGKRQ